MTTRRLRTDFLLRQLEKKFSYLNTTGESNLLKIKDASKILIIAPHPDDEVIGCSGLIQQVKANPTCKIKVCFVTVEDLRSISKPQYNEQGENERLEESKAAKKILGYDEAEYFLIPERTLDVSCVSKNIFRSNLERLLLDYRPTIIFLPNHFDMNPDHRSVCREGISLINEIISQKGMETETLFLYEIWGPLDATHSVILSNKMIESKKDAMDCYKTQMETVDYFSIMEKIQELRGRTVMDNSQEPFEPKEYFEFISTKCLSKYIIDHFQV